MNIIVVGCGKVGTTIISILVNEGHDIIAIDNNTSVVDEITNIYDVMGICGNSTNCETLIEANIEKAELFISVTDSDELNMLSCFIAKRMGAKNTIARIRNLEYNDKSLGFMRQQLDLTVSVNPELLAAREIYNILKLPNAVNIEKFSGRNFEMVELILKPDSSLPGTILADIKKKYNANFLICAVRRGNEVYIPDGEFELKSGDRIALIATPYEITKLFKMLGILQKQSKNVMILGASTTAYYLAKMLLASGTSVTIIDKNRIRCEEITQSLPNAVVICGDGTKQDLLAEECINSVDAFVALTGIDEENILVSFFASSQNVPKVVAKANNNELASMAEKLGLECLVSPHKTVANIIVRYARALKNSIGSNFESLYKIMDDKAEVLEFKVQPEFKHIEIPLKNMRLKQDILIAGIVRGRKTIIPSGDDIILPGDSIIIFAAGHIINDLSDIIQ